MNTALVFIPCFRVESSDILVNAQKQEEKGGEDHSRLKQTVEEESNQQNQQRIDSKDESTLFMGRQGEETKVDREGNNHIDILLSVFTITTTSIDDECYHCYNQEGIVGLEIIRQ